MTDRPALTNREFTALLKKAARNAQEGAELSSRITKAFNERYGVTHSDVDCDFLIDILEYGAGVHINSQIADDHMALCDAPNLHERMK